MRLVQWCKGYRYRKVNLASQVQILEKAPVISLQYLFGETWIYLVSHQLCLSIFENLKNKSRILFANGPGDLGSIPGRVIPKTQKMVLDASLLNTQHYKVRIKGKVEQSREGVAPSPTPWCSSYRKGSLRVTLDYGRQLYFTHNHKPNFNYKKTSWI